MAQRRILVVDDEPDIREVAKMSLEAVGGFDVITAGSGDDAIRCAEAARPDAILLDVMMPGLDGPATWRRLQAQEATRDIPVVLFTAKVQASERRRFDDLGVAGVLAKPFDPMALPTELSRALGWS